MSVLKFENSLAKFLNEEFAEEKMENSQLCMKTKNSAEIE